MGTSDGVSVRAQELLPRYLDALITALLGLLQGGQKLVQEGALTAMASVADCAKDNFIKFYDQARACAARHILTAWKLLIDRGHRGMPLANAPVCKRDQGQLGKQKSAMQWPA